MIRPHMRPFRLAALAGALALVVTASATAAPKQPTTTTTTTAKTTTAKKKTKTSTSGSTTTSRAASAPMGPTGKNCWQALIKDWYDGRIDKTYEVHCYRDALKHLPTDVRTYSDAYDVISRALADATRGKKHVDPNAPVPPPGGSNGGSGGTTTTTPNPSGDPSAGGPIDTGLNQGDRGATGIPIPLLVLGGLAILLVAAGGAGLLARRYQARRGGS